MTGGLLRHAAAAALTTLCVAGAGAVGLAGPAYAHTELDNAVPSAGTRLPTGPGNIQLSFTEPIDAGLATVVVRGPGGVNLAEGRARQNGPGLIQPMVAPAEAGRVRVSYRVVSLDGHPVSGSFTFRVLKGDPDSRAAVPGPGVPGAGDGDGVSPVLPVLAVAGVGVLLLAGGLRARRRRGEIVPTRPHTSPPAP
jgi:copper resistance protein C